MEKKKTRITTRIQIILKLKYRRKSGQETQKNACNGQYPTAQKPVTTNNES